MPLLVSHSLETLHADAVIIGSGFGGAMAAHRLLAAGARVIMVERGDWVARGDAAWLPDASLELTPHYDRESPIKIEKGGYGNEIGGYHCVGGPSVFYGCVSFRFRERDFHGEPDIVERSGAAWPVDYHDLEPFYAEAEQLIGVSGDDATDPTAPPRSAPFPQPPPPLAPVSRRIADAARSLGLSPFPLPLAINYDPARPGPDGAAPRRACVACRTCDTFACAIEAKNDVATTMIRPLVARGMTLRPRTIAVRLVPEGGRIVALRAFDKGRGAPVELRADRFILAAGALGTPHLLLASRLEQLNPAGDAVGRHLMRHKNAMVFGFFPSRPDPERVFHKQLAIHDYYFGDPGYSDAGKLGGIQQVMTPPAELVKAHLPAGTKRALGAFTEQLTGLLCIAEDQPRAENRVRVDFDRRDGFGLPQLEIVTQYTERDEFACWVLAHRARQVLRRSGAWFFHTHEIKTFSHAVGTVRMGRDPARNPLDAQGRFRGLDNLWITDGSALPTSGGVNPSLTIAANALRVASGVVARA